MKIAVFFRKDRATVYIKQEIPHGDSLTINIDLDTYTDHGGYIPYDDGDILNYKITNEKTRGCNDSDFTLQLAPNKANNLITMKAHIVRYTYSYEVHKYCPVVHIWMSYRPSYIHEDYEVVVPIDKCGILGIKTSAKVEISNTELSLLMLKTNNYYR